MLILFFLYVDFIVFVCFNVLFSYVSMYCFCMLILLFFYVDFIVFVCRFYCFCMF